MKIYAFGDSFTFGHGLPDRVDGIMQGLDTDPGSEYSWVRWLERLTGVPTVNRGMPGASNKLIQYRIQNSDIQPDDIAICMWSTYTRTCTFKSPDIIDRDDFAVFMAMDLNYPRDDEEKVKIYSANRSYFKYKYDDYDAQYDTWQIISHMDMYLKSKCRAVIHTTTFDVGILGDLAPTMFNVPLESPKSAQVPNWVYPVITGVFPGFYRERELPLCPDGHPGVEANEVFGRRLAEHLARLDLVNINNNVTSNMP